MTTLDYGALFLPAADALFQTLAALYIYEFWPSKHNTYTIIIQCCKLYTTYIPSFGTHGASYVFHHKQPVWALACCAKQESLCMLTFRSVQCFAV